MKLLMKRNRCCSLN